MLQRNDFSREKELRWETICRACLERGFTFSRTFARWLYSDTPSLDSFCRNCLDPSYDDIPINIGTFSFVNSQALRIGAV